MIELKKEFASLCWGLTKVNNKWEYYWHLLEKDEPQYIIYKDKMNNLLNLLNENDQELLNKDIENEIWDLI